MRCVIVTGMAKTRYTYREISSGSELSMDLLTNSTTSLDKFHVKFLPFLPSLPRHHRRGRAGEGKTLPPLLD